MTHKQIIIDGVDVSGCIYYADSKCTNSQMIQSNCKNVAVCYYKEYKAKEQECEELKDKLNCCFCKPQVGLEDMENFKKCVETTECFRRQLDQLKAENDKLKRLLKVRVEDLCDSCGASSMMPMPCKVYEKTLTEIKEIAEKIDDSGGCAYGDYDCDNCSSLEQETVCTYKVKKLILQKISECEVEE
jgi:hypothetical protein